VEELAIRGDLRVSSLRAREREQREREQREREREQRDREREREDGRGCMVRAVKLLLPGPAAPP
jgi:hypothetical protein